MGNIVHLPTKKKHLPEILRDLLNREKTGEIDNVILACKQKDGTVLTAYTNLDWGSRMELIGHLQADVIDSMIRANYVAPE